MKRIRLGVNIDHVATVLESSITAIATNAASAVVERRI